MTEETFDVIVIGGGTAGVIAGIAAALTRALRITWITTVAAMF